MLTICWLSDAKKNFSPLENLETVMSNSNNTPQVNHQNLSTCIIRKLERASSVAPSPNAQPFPNDPVLIASFVVENNREKRRVTEGKRPSEMSTAEHDALPACNWQSQHKNSGFAIKFDARSQVKTKLKH